MGKLYLAARRGFCNGVRRALECVHSLLTEQPEKVICVYNEIVHNNYVVGNMKKAGVRFIRSLDEVPANGVVVWSAHGVPPELKQQAAEKNLTAVDATCPLVRKLHDLAGRYCAENAAVILIGHAGHPEVTGVLGCGKIYNISQVADCAKLPDFPADQSVAVLTQTTWSMDEITPIIAELQKRYPALEVVSGICYATAERQQAVRDLISEHRIEKLLVIGSPASSNSNRLCEIARNCGVTALLIDDPQSLQDMDFGNCGRLGLTAGASAPDILLEQAVDILTKQHNFTLTGE